MRNKRFYATMAVLFIGTVSVISVIYIAQPILPVISKTFSVPPSQAALAVSINILALTRHFMANPNISVSMKGMVRHFKNRHLIGAFTIAFCLFFTYTGSFTFMTFYLSNPPFNLNTFELSLVFLVYISGVASPIAGTLSFRYGRKPVIYVGLLTALFGLLLTLVNLDSL